MNRLNRLVPLFAIAFFAACSTTGGGSPPAATPQNCAMLETIIAPRRTAYQAKCAAAGDPLTSDNCLILDGINLAIEGCWASAGGRPVPS